MYTWCIGPNITVINDLGPSAICKLEISTIISNIDTGHDKLFLFNVS